MGELTRLSGRAASLALALLVAAASPAGAHGIAGIEPTNYETTLTRVDPAVTGIEVEVIELGNSLRITNDTGHDVVVLGYEGEPYLRVGPRGVFENLRSPVDPGARPTWRRVSNGRVATWHDHRAHYTGTARPPVVRDDPGNYHVLDRWAVELRERGRTVRVHGLLAWVPPSSPLPYAALAVGLAALVVGLSRTRAWHSVLAVTLGALVVCATTHTAGLWRASSASLATKVAESAYSIAGIGLGLLALGWMWRRGAEASTPIVLVAAMFLLVAGGLADVATLSHSQVLSTLSPATARVVVGLTIGLGAGLAGAAVLRLREVGVSD